MLTALDLGRSEHATTATHVSEGSLTSTMGTTIGDMGDKGHGAFGTPGLGEGLVSGLLGHGVGLAHNGYCNGHWRRWGEVDYTKFYQE